jgi:tetratricopeptide (TPR) repeat protein
LGVILLAGLIYLLLYDWPALGATLSVMAAAVVFVLGLLGLREDKDFFPRLSHFLGKSRPAQAVMAIVLVASIALWGVVGRPKVAAVVCGNLGCKPSGVQRLAIGEFKNLTPGSTEFDSLWSEGTVEMLKEKLAQVTSLQVINQASDQVTEKTKHELDYWVEGNVQVIDQAELSARLSGRGGQYLPPDVQVVGEPANTLANVTALQDALALALLKRLGVEVSPALASTIANTPTGDLEALKLNNEGVGLLAQEDFVNAESRLRAALSLDPKYGAAYSNLGFALAGQGQYDGAIAAYQAAIEQVPRYAPFHYNLGHLHATLGNTDQALLSLNEAIRLDPGYARAYNELGNVYIQLEQWADARIALEQGLALDPTFAPLHKNLGRVALAQGRTDEAIASLEKAIQLYEEKPLEPIYWLAEAQAGAGDATAACQQLAAYWVLDPNRISQWAPAAMDLAARLACP